jgi:hypothetical protein
MRLPELIILGVIIWFGVRVVLSLGGAPLYCVTCGTTGRPKSVTRGSLLIEVFLWLCFIVPGFLYSLWRLTTRHKACGTCGSEQIIPPSSPRAAAEAQRLRGPPPLPPPLPPQAWKR